MRSLALATLLLLSGCCSSEVAESVRLLRRDHEIYRRATVPHPSYGPAGRAAVAALGSAIDAHLEELETLTR